MEVLMIANNVAGQTPELTLSPNEMAQMERILEEFRGQRGAVIPILQQTQDLFGYLPNAALRLISQRTLIPLTQLQGVATFYAQFHLNRRGKHLVRICDGTACHVRGAPKAIEAVKKSTGVEPGTTAPDFSLTVEIVYCLGSCGLSPVALVDEQVLGRLQPDDLVRRLKQLD
jgi:NADH-quinone oxidoreductase subunit E